jgi:hypothetical protein
VASACRSPSSRVSGTGESRSSPRTDGGALGREELPGFEAHLGPEHPLALGHLRLFERQLVLGHAEAPRPPAVQVERQGDARHHIVVRAGHSFLETHIEHRVRPKPGLEEPPLGRLHLGAGCLQLRVFSKRPLDERVDGERLRLTWLHCLSHATCNPGYAHQECQEEACPAPHDGHLLAHGDGEAA